MILTTPEKIRSLRRKLYVKAKAERTHPARTTDGSVFF